MVACIFDALLQRRQGLHPFERFNNSLACRHFAKVYGAAKGADCHAHLASEALLRQPAPSLQLDRKVHLRLED